MQTLQKSPTKQIIQLAWPSILELIMVTLFQYVDTAMVGSLGVNATAAIAVNWSALMLSNGLMFSVGIGFGIQVAQAIGAKKYDETKNIVKNGYVTALCFGVLLSILVCLFSLFYPKISGVEDAIAPLATGYLFIIGCQLFLQILFFISSSILRFSGDTRTPMFFNGLSNVMNIILNILLIFPTRTLLVFGFSFTLPGAGLGVYGAALATAISTATAGILITTRVFTHASPVQPTRDKQFRLHLPTIRRALQLGIPTAFERVSMSLGYMLLTRLVTGLGTVALATHHIVVNAESMFSMPPNGFANATSSLVGQSIGAKDEKAAVQYTKSALKSCLVLIIFTVFLLFILAKPLMGFFTKDVQAIHLGTQMLRIIAFAQPFHAISNILCGTFRGAGDTKYPFYLTLIGIWGIRLVFSFVLGHLFHWGLYGIWISIFADNTVRAILAIVYMKKGKWKNKKAL